jgi:K+-transporting ATPase c subunit
VSGSVNEHIERPFAGVIDEPRVNVLALNLTLDQAAPK